MKLCSIPNVKLKSISNLQLRSISTFQGCACKFLYGPGTDEDKKEAIEKALEAKDELQIEVQFYKKNGKWAQTMLEIFRNTEDLVK